MKSNQNYDWIISCQSFLFKLIRISYEFINKSRVIEPSLLVRCIVHNAYLVALLHILLHRNVRPKLSWILQMHATVHAAKETAVCILFNSIWPRDRTVSGAAIPGLSGPSNDGNKGVLCIPQSSSITGISPSHCLVSYLGHSLRGSYPSAEMQSVYSAAPADRATEGLEILTDIGGGELLWYLSLALILLPFVQQQLSFWLDVRRLLVSLTCTCSYAGIHLSLLPGRSHP